MVRPYRKDGFCWRTRLTVHIEEETCEQVRELASALNVSVNHFFDLLAQIAVDEGGDWFASKIRERYEEALRRARRRRYGI